MFEVSIGLELSGVVNRCHGLSVEALQDCKSAGRRYESHWILVADV